LEGFTKDNRIDIHSQIELPSLSSEEEPSEAHLSFVRESVGNTSRKDPDALFLCVSRGNPKLILESMRDINWMPKLVVVYPLSNYEKLDPELTQFIVGFDQTHVTLTSFSPSY